MWALLDKSAHERRAAADGPTFGTTGSKAERSGLGGAGCAGRDGAQPAAAGYMPEASVLLYPGGAAGRRSLFGPHCRPLPVPICIRPTGRRPVLRRGHEVQPGLPGRHYGASGTEGDRAEPLLSLRDPGMEAAEPAHCGTGELLCKGPHQSVPAGTQCRNAGTLASLARGIPALSEPETSARRHLHQRGRQRPWLCVPGFRGALRGRKDPCFGQGMGLRAVRDRRFPPKCGGRAPEAVQGVRPEGFHE